MKKLLGIAIATISVMGLSMPQLCSEFSFVLKPSPLGGIGVFAVHDIPVGAQLLQGLAVRKCKIQDIPEAFLKYCVFISDEECFCPQQFDRMEIGWYINHSLTPNAAVKKDSCTSCELVLAERTTLCNQSYPRG